MSNEQETVTVKQKPKKVVLKNQIERYLRIPFFLLIPLVLLNCVIYFRDIETGIGLVIGTVESVRTGDDGLAQYAVLAPAARLGELSEVFIIKDFDIVD